MGSPGLGKVEVLSACLLQQARGGEGGGSASAMRGKIAAVRLAEDLGWIPLTVGPVLLRLAKCAEGPGFQFYLSPRALREAARPGWGVPEGKPVVARMCLSWFASLQVAEAASVRAADVRGDKALGFLATKRGRVGSRWRIWSKWSRAWGDFFRDWTKGWDPEAPVVPGGAPVLEVAMAYYLEGTEWAEGRWHGHRRGGAAAAWARGPP